MSHKAKMTWWCYNLMMLQPWNIFPNIFCPWEISIWIHRKAQGPKIVNKILTHNPKENLNVLHIHCSVSSFLSSMPSFWFWSYRQPPIIKVYCKYVTVVRDCFWLFCDWFCCFFVYTLCHPWHTFQFLENFQISHISKWFWCYVILAFLWSLGAVWGKKNTKSHFVNVWPVRLFFKGQPWSWKSQFGNLLR